jgi:polygalacturonase
VLAAPFLRSQGTRRRREFNVRDYGAIGDGATPDTAALQRAIDAAGAAGPGSRVIVPGGRRFLVGSLELRTGLELHLADDAELLASADPADYTGPALLHALDLPGLRITGTGRINGRAKEFMTHFDEAKEIWVPKKFRPRLAVLTGCHDLAVENITFFEAPSWTLHLLGCRGVAVAGIKIRNHLDVPNCDGIDPDHCRDVEIKNCDITCGDDAIVVKATRDCLAYGGSENIRVSNCVLRTQDSGVKIGTETVADIRNVRFERCDIQSCCRGCTIQLRDEGNVSDIEFRDIHFSARYHSAPWWGRGEGISFTAIPRTPETKVGTISNIRVVNVTGRSENSVRLSGSPQSRIRDVRFENVDLTFDRWTKYPGAEWDNRPTTAMPGIEPHPTPAIHVRHADQISFKDTRVAWGANPPDYFTHALEAENVTELDRTGLQGTAAYPRGEAVKIH